MFRAILSIILGLAFSSPLFAQSAKADLPPAEIMVLGSFHFTGGGEDLVNAEVDDFLAPRRQEEIAEAVARLAEFAPTRIVVELTPEYEERFNQRYLEYRLGDRELSVNERQQLGMRLAGLFGLPRLYAVDYQSDMDFDGMLEAANAAGQSDVLGLFGQTMTEIRAIMAAQSTSDATVLDRLIEQNSAEITELHHMYLVMAQMGSMDNPVGAEQMEIWWGRNLRIYANIARVAEPGERVLVIYGSGHKYLLDQFIQNSPNHTWVDPLDYMQ